MATPIQERGTIIPRPDTSKNGTTEYSPSFEKTPQEMFQWLAPRLPWLPQLLTENTPEDSAYIRLYALNDYLSFTHPEKIYYAKTKAPINFVADHWKRWHDPEHKFLFDLSGDGPKMPIVRTDTMIAFIYHLAMTQEETDAMRLTKFSWEPYPALAYIYAPGILTADETEIAALQVERDQLQKAYAQEEADHRKTQRNVVNLEMTINQQRTTNLTLLFERDEAQRALGKEQAAHLQTVASLHTVREANEELLDQNNTLQQEITRLQAELAKRPEETDSLSETNQTTIGPEQMEELTITRAANAVLQRKNAELEEHLAAARSLHTNQELERQLRHAQEAGVNGTHFWQSFEHNLDPDQIDIMQLFAKGESFEDIASTTGLTVAQVGIHVLTVIREYGKYHACSPKKHR